MILGRNDDLEIAEQHRLTPSSYKLLSQHFVAIYFPSSVVPNECFV